MMSKKYIFNEDDIKEALKETFLDLNVAYSYSIKQIEAENYYGDKYKTVVVEVTEL